jgi:BirA family biotin operon repressor/biotin-[acetyl-CoA-carboxylase] ligase
MTIAEMLPFLADKGLAEKIYIYEVLESSNETAKEMAKAGAAHGTIVIANHQTKGKGRFGRSFFSPPGCGIYMSFILRNPELKADLITAFAAVAVCGAIESTTGKSPQIKWVNDILLDGKKICGILTEAVAGCYILGIGVNFIAPAEGFPHDLAHKTASIYTGAAPPISREALAAEIINRIMGEKPDKSAIMAEYKKRLAMLGKRVVVSGIGGGASFEAVILDIDDMARLIVKKDDGKLLELSSGEIRILGHH